MLKKTINRLLFNLLGLLVLMMAQPALADSGFATTLLASTPDGIRGVLDLNAAPLYASHPTPFRLHVTDAENNQLPGATIQSDLTMPAMPVPENRPAVIENNGDYVGEAIFPTPGAWEVAFDLTWPDGRQARLVFSIDKVYMK